MQARDEKYGAGATRERLIAAGARLFGLHGFEATATRELAAAAKVNLGAIRYHFGGKEGLYRAVLEHVAAFMHQMVGPGLERVHAACADSSAGRPELLLALEVLVRTVTNAMFGSPESREFSRIMMQEQIAPTDCCDVLYSGFFDGMYAAWAELVAKFTGLPVTGGELHLRTLSIMGQLIIFRVGTQGILRRIGCTRFSEAQLECINRFVIQQIKAILAGFSPVCGALEEKGNRT